jgi:hypothetical protein
MGVCVVKYQETKNIEIEQLLQMIENKIKLVDRP